jgi:cbb3-type cytochrome oxidase subunit 3
MRDFVQIILWLRAHSVIPMMLVFLVIACAAYWPGRRNKIEDNGMIPFRDEA